MNKKLIALGIIVGFLVSVIPTYAMVQVFPTNQTFARSGATWTVVFECGLNTVTGVNHNVVLRVHNNKNTNQYFYMKILDEYNFPAPPAYWLWSVEGGSTLYRTTILPDGLLALACDDILWIIDSTGSVTYARGVLVLSHPGATTDLDVIATEIVSAASGAYNEQVIYVPGVRVSNIPTPCVPRPTDPTKCQVLPL